jgi:uncharacterized SAM-binding protein YcdF (DUF218 family)
MRSGILPTGDSVNQPPRRTLLRRWRVWIAGMAVFLLLLYALHPFILTGAGRWLDVGEQLRSPVDCVMVLGGEANTRPFLAAAIFRAGYARRVLIPEVVEPSSDVEGAIPAEHEMMRRVLLKRGVPPDAIQQLDGPVDSTRDEAVALREYLASNPKSSVAVVTSNFHTRRARLIFRRLHPAHRDQIHFISCPTDGIGPDNWWQFKDGIVWYAAEYAKLFRDYWR